MLQLHPAVSIQLSHLHDCFLGGVKKEMHFSIIVTDVTAVKTLLLFWDLLTISEQFF